MDKYLREGISLQKIIGALKKSAKETFPQGKTELLLCIDQDNCKLPLSDLARINKIYHEGSRLGTDLTPLVDCSITLNIYSRKSYGSVTRYAVYIDLWRGNVHTNISFQNNRATNILKTINFYTTDKSLQEQLAST
jgi:FAD/FMN-containing dehydrogenase